MAFSLPSQGHQCIGELSDDESQCPPWGSDEPVRWQGPSQSRTSERTGGPQQHASHYPGELGTN